MHLVPRTNSEAGRRELWYPFALNANVGKDFKDGLWPKTSNHNNFNINKKLLEELMIKHTFREMLQLI
jgi:hypothetical protein